VNIVPGVYKHFKGNRYEVIGLAKHSEGETDMVVYRPLYGNRDLWVRPLDMFTEMVEVDGCSKPRFEFLETVGE
jgi:hypothetical protein